MWSSRRRRTGTFICHNCVIYEPTNIAKSSTINFKYILQILAFPAPQLPSRASMSHKVGMVRTAKDMLGAAKTVLVVVAATVTKLARRRRR